MPFASANCSAALPAGAENVGEVDKRIFSAVWQGAGLAVCHSLKRLVQKGVQTAAAAQHYAGAQHGEGERGAVPDVFKHAQKLVVAKAQVGVRVRRKLVFGVDAPESAGAVNAAVAEQHALDVQTLRGFRQKPRAARFLGKIGGEAGRAFAAKACGDQQIGFAYFFYRIKRYLSEVFAFGAFGIKAAAVTGVDNVDIALFVLALIHQRVAKTAGNGAPADDDGFALQLIEFFLFDLRHLSPVDLKFIKTFF